ncbi:cytochrome P450 [Haematococcus lacustris]|uniref:Cytochrome P450 n=1 Tax=Haematococcus lacustris TaxID=44745 RepID=A0A699Z1F7_HAELA|nr:cytochrome P450 [Haematococcus lacustris]
MQAALHEFLGEGLVTLPDGVRHAEARAVLDPGFRAEFVKGMLPTMAAVAQELVDTMLFKAGAGHAKDVEVEELCRRATLDVLGRTAFRFDFQALAVARGASQGVELAAEAAQNGSLSGSAPRYADAVTLWDAVLGPAMLIAFDMKAVPHFVFPGYAGYQEGLRTFNQLVKTMITKRRAEGLHDGSKDLLTVMLQAQQQGNSLMTDKHISPDAFMPFSTGGRACIGRYMAVLEAQVVLAVLLQRLELSPPKGGAPEVSVKQAFTLKSSQGVPVSVKPLA